jgi:hypothetical protein
MTRKRATEHVRRAVKPDGALRTAASLAILLLVIVAVMT